MLEGYRLVEKIAVEWRNQGASNPVYNLAEVNGNDQPRFFNICAAACCSFGQSDPSSNI
jgi:hypothetical protein